METVKHRIILTLIVLAVVAAFSNRAVYLDEHIFIQIARSAQTNWMFPNDTPGVFFGMPKANFADHTHPPAVEYYLAALVAIFGDFREIPFRLAFAIFPIACALGFYELARRFTAQPFFVSLLFTSAPAFVVYSPTLMMDIPMLAFLLVGLVFYFAYVDRAESSAEVGDNRQQSPGETSPRAAMSRMSGRTIEKAGPRIYLVGAALCFVLAAGSGYTALVPLGCLFLAMVAARRPWQELAAVAAAPAALAVWLAMVTIHFDGFPLGRTVRFFASQSSPMHNLLATFSFVGGVGLFPWTFPARRQWLIGGLAGALLLTLFATWPSMASRLWYAALAAFGIVLLRSFGAAARRLMTSGKNHGEAVFILWVPATLLFFFLVADMINARYVLLTIPALYLVLFRDTSRRRLMYMLVPTAALSLVVAYADLRFVNSYRDFVDSRVLPLQQSGFKVWSAAESGPRFYLEEGGAPALTMVDLRPGPMDMVVRSTGRYRYGLPEKLSVILTSVKTFTIEESFPVRTFNDAAGAGFHDSRLGFVPFTFSRAPLDALEIAQVSPLPGAVWSPGGPILRQTEAELVFPLKIPADTKIEYDLEGEGAVEVTSLGLRLKRGPQPVIVWRNFRVVPRQLSIE